MKNHQRHETDWSPVAMILIVLVSVAIGVLIGSQVQPARYVTSGVMYPDGTIITDDGNAWRYDFSDGVKVDITFDNNGTNDDVTDDRIVRITTK